MHKILSAKTLQKKNVIKSECTAIGMQSVHFKIIQSALLRDLESEKWLSSWSLSMWFLCFTKIIKKRLPLEKRAWDTEKSEDPLYLIFLFFMDQQCNHRQVFSSTEYWWILKNPSHPHFLGPLQWRVALSLRGEICHGPSAVKDCA